MVEIFVKNYNILKNVVVLSHISSISVNILFVKIRLPLILVI